VLSIFQFLSTKNQKVMKLRSYHFTLNWVTEWEGSETILCFRLLSYGWLQNRFNLRCITFQFCLICYFQQFKVFWYSYILYSNLNFSGPEIHQRDFAWWGWRSRHFVRRGRTVQRRPRGQTSLRGRRRKTNPKSHLVQRLGDFAR